MISAAIPLAALADQAASTFRSRLGYDPQYLVAAPGRVNLIGEHTDYNGGYVLPMAIERYVVIAAAPATDGEAGARVYSAEKNAEARLQIAGRIEPGPVSWSSYLQGVVAGFVARGAVLQPFDAVIESTVPLGGGLSSSAALEVAMATLLEAICGQSLGPVEKALLCQAAENRFAKMPCGIMDQFSSALCRADHLMLLDCRSRETTFVPLTDPGVIVLIANSNVKHEHTTGEYAKRRAECETAARALGVQALRDATGAQLEAARDKLDDAVYRRARHVISENDRTLRAAQALREDHWNDLGQLMYASHDSLRDDFEVSCRELDLLVDLAREIGPAGGMIGSRMTGGGFGGCTVSVVEAAAAQRIAETLADRYQHETGIEPTIFTSRPAQSAHVLRRPQS